MLHKLGSAVNIDIDLFWYIYKSCGDDLGEVEKQLSMYLDEYRDKGISDLLFCIFTQCSIVPTETMTWFADNLNRREEDGVSVDYTREDRLLPCKLAYENFDGDPMEFLLNKTRDMGMRAWISVRMNDCHGAHQRTNWIRGDIYYEARKNGWMIGDEAVAPYYGECFDYSHPEIRDRMYRYIVEMLDRYDTDGLELDYMRELFCFDYKNNPDCADIMTEFLTRVRAYVRKKELERGHSIRLAVRVCRDAEHNKIFGIDVARWIREGLVDVVIPTSRWHSTDTEIPVKEWKRLTDGTKVEIWPGIEFFIKLPAVNSHETVRAMTAQYSDLGADKIYIYNYYRECAQRDGDMASEYGLDTSHFLDYDSNYREIDARNVAIWRTASDPCAAHTGVRRYIVTGVEPLLIPEGVSQIQPLPTDATDGVTLTKTTGDVTGCHLILYLGIESGTEAPEVTFDGKRAELLGESTDAYFTFCEICGGDRTALGNNVYYAYSVTAGDGFERRITVRGNCTVNALEIKATK